MNIKLHTVNAKFRPLQREAENLVRELDATVQPTEEREAAIYARLQEIDKAIYG